MKKRRILLVEDEQDIADLVSLHLRELCDEVVVAGDGYEGMRHATSGNWSMAILDLCLPGPDGLEICRAIRRDSSYLPILMFTAKTLVGHAFPVQSIKQLDHISGSFGLQWHQTV